MSEQAIGLSRIESRSSVAGFHWSLLLTTLAPYVVLLAQYLGVSGAGVTLAIIAFVATAHVPATFYLLTDGAIREFVLTRKGSMIYGCLAIMAVTYIVFLSFAANVGGGAPIVVYWFMLAYTLWQTWHFGKQNIGVFAFSCICDRRGPASKVERAAITAGTVAGLIGVYQAVGSDLHKSYYPGGDVGWVHSTFNGLWYLGVILICIALVMAIKALTEQRLSPLNAMLLVSSALFFVPYFFVGDALLAFASFTWAHGLQYILFLGAHAAARSDRSQPSSRWVWIAGFAAFVALCGWFVRDLIVWMTSAGTATAAFLQVQANYPMLLNFVIATLTGLTMVHFVWDARIWRMRDPEPRKWMRERFAFLFNK